MPSDNGRIVVINDFYPSERPGAASEALNSAIAIAADGNFHVQFFSSGKFGSKFYAGNVLCRQIQRWQIQNFFLSKSNRLILVRFLKSILRHINLGRLIPVIIKNRHSDFILHSIGTFFPFSTIAILSAFRVRVFQVHHDYQCLIPEKIYPVHFLDKEKIEACANIFEEAVRLVVTHYSMRRFILRVVLNAMTTQVSLTELQSKILTANGLKSTKTLVQTVATCQCSKLKDYSKIAVNPSMKVLFIGRIIGKGFQELIDLIRMSSSLHLVVVSSDHVLPVLKKSLPDDKFDFLGKLSPVQVISAIHASDIVWARSTSFDVGPLTILEALAHGVPVVCTPTTGNSEHARKLMSSLVQPLDFKPDESYILSVVEEWRVSQNEQKSKDYVNLLPKDAYLKMIAR